MNQEVKAQWLVALRSGEYQQNKGSLRNEDRFCCLGVLCDLHAKAGLGDWDGDLYQDKVGGNDMKVPTTDVQQWAGIRESMPILGVTKHTVTDYNDGVFWLRPHSFAEIADLIEEHL